eukprot:Seg3104.2 transcript_id=Seg3104.2/GoldUCD/mRNA.D3Y31 product="Sperm-associated antigen 1" protein_id=Seg3104.2/GoldUCD/D3Y31
MEAVFGLCRSDNNIPISHLDYKYIEKCSDAKEIGKILQILRSGEEGTYPDLIRFTERRLESLNPESKLLLKENKVKRVDEIKKDESSLLLEDLQTWTNQMADLDKNLLKKSEENTSHVEFPPVRSTAKTENVAAQTESTKKKASSKRVAPRSYDEWEKVNVEEEAKKVDEVVNKVPSEKARIPHVNKSLSSTVDKQAYTEEGRSMKANQEKEKGNEAFKSRDFDEALIYYNRSISLEPTAAVVNNRAITYINMERFEDAILDCNTVLTEEPKNVKAFLRRGIALKSLKRYERALKDFENVLKYAPGNKRAKILHEEVTKTLKDIGGNKNLEGKEEQSRKGKKLLIEEVESLEETKMEETVVEENKVTNEKKKGKRMKIIEVENIEDSEIIAKSNENRPEEKVTNGHSDSSGKSKDSKADVTGSISTEGIDNEAASEKQSLISKKQTKERDVVTEPADEPVEANATKPTEENIIVEESKKMKKEESEMINSEPPPVLPTPAPPVALLPEDVLALKDEGNGMYKAGKYAEAKKKYTEAISRLKDSKGYEQSIAVLLSNRAVCKSKIGDCKGCIKDATESLEITPSAKAYLRRAAAYESLEKYRVAYMDYQAAVIMDNTLQAAWHGSTRLMNLLRKQDGVEWRDKLRKPEPQSDNRKEIEPPSIAGNNVVASESLNVKQSDNNDRKDVQKKEEGNGKKKVKTAFNEEQFKVIKEQGNLFVQRKEYENAINCYSRCIELMPNEATSYTNRALCFLKLDKPISAESDCTKALEIYGGNVKALFRRATARKVLQKYAEASVDLRNLLKVDPNNSAAKKEVDSIAALWKQSLLEQVAEQRKIPTAEEQVKVDTKIEDKKINNSKTDSDSDKDTKNSNGISDEKLNENLKEVMDEINKEEKRKGKRLKIVEVDEYDDVNKKDYNKVEEKMTEDILEGGNTKKGTEKKAGIDANARRNGVGNSGKADDKNVEVDVTDPFTEFEQRRKQESDSQQAKAASNEQANSKQQTGSPSMGKIQGARNVDELVSDEKNSDKNIDGNESPLDPLIIENESENLSDDVLKLKDKASAFSKMGRYADAIGCYTDAINALNSDPSSHTEFLAALLAERADCRSRTGNLKGCIEDATQSLEIKPSAEAYMKRAMAYESLEKYRLAYVDIHAALRFNQSEQQAWAASTRLTGILRKQDGPSWRKKLPKNQADVVSKLPEPESTTTTKRVQDPGSKTQNKTTAQEISSDSKVSDSTDKVPKASKGEALHGPKVKDMKSAKKSVETREDKFKRIKELGGKCVQEGKFQDATTYYSHCIDLFPNEVTSYTNRALCHLKLNKAKKAEVDCSKALEIQPGNIKAFFRRGLARKAIGRYRDALQDLTTLLKLDAQNSAARKELEVVKDLWREELKNTQVKGAEPNTKTKEASSETQKTKKGKSSKIEEIQTGSSKPEESSKTATPAKATGTKPASQPGKAATVKETLQKSPRKFNLKKASGFEFLKAWNELKGRSLKEHADLLTQIEPSQLPKVISNKIDGEMIQTVVSCVHELFMTKDKLLNGFNILRYISKTDRFNMVVMFLSTKDLSKIKKVIEDLELKLRDSNVSVTVKEISELKKAYKVT